MSEPILLENTGQEDIQGISEIAVQGYKSLYDKSSIEIRPLTILAGANSSGKSSIMQPLLLLKQTLEAPYNPEGLLIYGTNVKFTLTNQLLSFISEDKKADEFKIRITIYRSIYKNLSLENTYKVQSGKGFCVSKVSFQDYRGKNTYSRDMKKNEIIEFLISLKQSYQILQNRDEVISKHFEYEFDDERGFLDLECLSKVEAIPGDKDSLINGILYNSLNDTNIFRNKISEIIHLPGLRGSPERSYPTTAIGNQYPGIFDKYFASIIHDWQINNDERIHKLEDYLILLGLTSKIAAGKPNDIQIELSVSISPQAKNNLVNIADVGIGVSQVLPVIVALLVAKPGQLVYLEQPELHLHPRAQIALSEILADAAKRGVKIVLETHSELLLLGIQSLVAEDKLPPELVKLHWFTKGEDGITKISSADLDETGAFGDWPEDFATISLSLENRYLTAAETKLWREINVK